MSIVRIINWTPEYMDYDHPDLITGGEIHGPIAGDVFVSCTCTKFDNGLEVHVHEYRRPTTITHEVERDNYVKCFGRS